VNGRESKWPYWVISIGAACVLVLTVMIAIIGSGGSSAARAANPSSRPAPSATTPLSVAPPAPTPPVPASGAPHPALGVYAGPGAQAAVASFATAVGAPTAYALDYLDGSSWQTIADPSWILAKWTGSPYRMILVVPMLVPGSNLAEGASGAYDADFDQLATNLVNEGFASSWLVIGSDPNVSTALWHVDSSLTASEYVSYWNQIVKTMRSVPGESFRFVWDTTPLTNGITPQDVYPGNASVDVIATDAFDADPEVPAAQRWSSLLNGMYGLNWFATFSSHEGKPLMLAKWGVVPATVPGGNGDDPSFVRQLWTWSASNRVAVLVTWDYGTWSVTGGGFPQSLAALRSVTVDGAK